MLVLNRILKEPIFGAYTELYGGLSEDIKMENNGTFGRSSITKSCKMLLTDTQLLAVPWGKLQSPRADIAQSCKGTDENGTGVAAQFWDWTEKQVEKYK
jgi:retinol dehydrogenase-12